MSETKQYAVHYASGGEDSLRVNCGQYFTTDVAHTANKEKVTCKFCIRIFKSLTP